MFDNVEGRWLALITGQTPRGTVPYEAPAITEDSRDFWMGGAQGELRIYCCQDCDRYIHPPVPVCRYCRSMAVTPKAVSGRGVVSSYTVNHQQWSDTFDGPYVIAQVEIEEDPAVQLTTNIVDCSLDEITIGLAVEVTFHQIDDAWLPLFRPLR